MKTGKQNEEYKWRFSIKIQRDDQQNTQRNKILVNELGMMSHLLLPRFIWLDDLLHTLKVMINIF